MSDYIDLKVVGQVIAVGLLLGAGLPLVFATGLRALSAGTEATTTGADSAVGFRMTTNPMARALGVACLLVVALVVALGIYVILHKS